jgi:hypothetical protein
VSVLYVDVSHHDVDRRNGVLPDWSQVRAATSHVMCARATYGDPAGYHPGTRFFAELQRGARDAGLTVRGGYHNLVRGDQASINRQVDWLRSELDGCNCCWAMVDVEPYPALRTNGLWPRMEDAQRFSDRWRSIDSRTLAVYLPRWVWADWLGSPDLRPLGCPLVSSRYGGPIAPPADVYRAQGGDGGLGWEPYGNVTPSVWQFTSQSPVPGLSSLTDVNAIRDPAVLGLLSGGDMGGWRVARGLDKLLAQINAMAPNRSKASDGSIGDATHQSTSSDHNPDEFGIVRARDFTQDPAHGADMFAISEALRLSRDRRIKYVIFNRRIFSATNTPWTWRPYDGPSAHTEHMHVSTVADNAIADDTRDWEIGMTPEELFAATLPNGSSFGGAIVTIMNRTDYLANKLGLATKLDQILAAAVDDGNTTVTMSEEDRQILAQTLAAAIAAPTLEDVRGVVDEELDKSFRGAADAA